MELTEGASTCDTTPVPQDRSDLSSVIMPHLEAVAARHQSEVVLFQLRPATVPLTKTAAKGITPRHNIRHGSDAAAEIVDYADVNDIDLIAMSSHGRSGVSRWVFGSVASKMLSGTDNPLSLIRAPGAPISNA